MNPSVMTYRFPFDGPADALPGKETVGSKAHGLMRMARAGLPVPAGFVLPVGLCRDYMARGTAALDDLDRVIAHELDHLGTVTGRGFGDGKRPLLLSVRSGAAISMPGMMETVLNIGLTPATLHGLVRMTGNPRLAQDCRRRLIQQYGEVVAGIAPARFDARRDAILDAYGLDDLADLDTTGLARLADAFEEVFEAETDAALPQNPLVQLRDAIAAVLRSWSSQRAASYRRLNAITDDLGTAVTVQAMAFGNLGPTSGSGVGFTRSPADGSNQLYVDFLANAQGEDVVAGRHAAQGLAELARRAPAAHQALIAAKDVLEREFGDMQDFEFTVENGRLLLLQARSGKRTPLAALRIARDLAAGGVITRAEALERLAGLDLESIEETGLQVAPDVRPIALGMPAGIGVAVGLAAFDPDRALTLARAAGAGGGNGDGGRDGVILIRPTAETADIAALAEAAGLITAQGARTSHAAVVARQLGKPCIVACPGLVVDPSGRCARLAGEPIAEGDPISLDAGTGKVFKGRLPIIRQRPAELIAEIQAWRRPGLVEVGQA